MDKRTDDLLACFRDTPDSLVFWTFRYFMGRRTIHACCFARDLAGAWPYLDKHTQTAIRRELDAAFESDDRARDEQSAMDARITLPLGDDCDREAWELVREAYRKVVSDAQTSNRTTEGRRIIRVDAGRLCGSRDMAQASHVLPL